MFVCFARCCVYFCCIFIKLRTLCTYIRIVSDPNHIRRVGVNHLTHMQFSFWCLFIFFFVLNQTRILPILSMYVCSLINCVFFFGLSVEEYSVHQTKMLDELLVMMDNIHLNNLWAHIALLVFLCNEIETLAYTKKSSAFLSSISFLAVKSKSQSMSIFN